MKRLRFGLVVVMSVRGRGVALGWMPEMQVGQRCSAVIIGPRPQVRVALAHMGLRTTRNQS